jgi:hypothetical protein
LNLSIGNKLIEVVDISEVFWTNLGGKSWCATIFMWFLEVYKVPSFTRKKLNF